LSNVTSVDTEVDSDSDNPFYGSPTIA